VGTLKSFWLMFGPAPPRRLSLPSDPLVQKTDLLSRLPARDHHG